MNSAWILGSLLSGALAVAGAQNQGAAPQPQPQRGLVRAQPAAPPTIEPWREQLRATDLEARERSYEQLLRSARRDGTLRAALEQWARDDAERELAWTARLALRELRADPFAQIWSDDLGFGLDLGPLRRIDPQQWLDDAQRRRDGWLGGNAPQPATPDAQSSFQSFSLEVSPDGVKCKVTKRGDGQDVTEEYSAPTMEELLQAHPELKAHVGGHGGLAFGARPAPAPLPAPQPQAPAPPHGTEVRTDILGVAVQPLTAEEAQSLGLEPGLGLRIERVEPGTLARQLGLQRGQVLIEINGAPIRSRDDITAQIKQRAVDGELKVIVLDRWGQKRARAWKPEALKQI